MSNGRYRATELDDAKRYANRLRKNVADPVRVVRSGGQIVVQAVKDERRASQGPPEGKPERRKSAH